MQTSSVSAQESGNLFSFVSRLGQFAFDCRFNNVNSNGYSSILPNYLYFDGPGVWVGKKRPRAVASLSLGGKSGSFGRKLFNEFNRAVRFHCEKIPIGFASVGSGSGDTDPGDVNGLREDGYGVLVDEGAHLNGVKPCGPKKVLILMSDTGGGHRASAEAIKVAFNEEFGDEYQVRFDCLVLMN